MAQKNGRVRFGVDLDRQVEADIDTIARTVEKRAKVDFHRRLCGRLVQAWKSHPERLLEMGLIRKGE